MIAHTSRFPMRQMLTVGLLPSPLKVAYYRLRGAKIGAGVSIGLGSVILTKGPIEIGDGASIGMFTAITCARLSIGKRTTIRSFIIIDAQQVTIGDDVIISETALIRALVPSSQSSIIIHDRAHIFPFSMIDPSRQVEIGEESSIGYSTYLFTHTAYKSKLDGYPVEFGPVQIGKRVWIPCRVFITPSVTIGDDAVIGTGALVNHDIPAGALAVGAPARVIKSKEQYAVTYSSQEKFDILIDILNEFCQYLHDYAQVTWQRSQAGERLIWRLTSPGGKPGFLELLALPSAATPEYISVILEAVPGETQTTWDARKKVWFSIGSRRCSAQLDAWGEELREFFRRYGLYFVRP